MGALTERIKQAFVTLIDPEKDARIQWLVDTMKHGLTTERRKFSLSKSIEGVKCKPDELAAAKERVYTSLLKKSWKDEEFSQEEKDIAQWVAQCIELTPQETAQFNLLHAYEAFSIALSRYMEDGTINSLEEAHLNRIAASVGMNLPTFAREFFGKEGERFLCGIFAAYVQDNELTQDEWNGLVKTSEQLGVPHSVLLETISPQARVFVEHVLADAKSDQRLTEREVETLNWLVANLGLRDSFRRYINDEISVLRTLTNIEDGKLPNLKPPKSYEFRAGELVHFRAMATWSQIRQLRSGAKIDQSKGDLFLTDNRLIFASPEKSHAFGYRKIISHKGNAQTLSIQVEGKPLQKYSLEEESRIGYPILRSALALANQTKLNRAEQIPTRHIPREVRQRVWQRYGARCAECSANDYLEFDHIIPVAKGGSNSDSNVQLLCRRCNLKKSDKI